MVLLLVYDFQKNDIKHCMKFLNNINQNRFDGINAHVKLAINP